MPQTSEARRLIALARKREDAHLQAARSAVLRQFRKVALKAAEAELTRVLALPPGRRRASLPLVLRRIDEAMIATRTPPAELTAVLKRAVRDRVLSLTDLAALTNRETIFKDTQELEAQAVSQQRKRMNFYWDKESRHFRDMAALSIRESIRRGLSPEKAADLLQERLKVSRSRTVLIAQDQLLTAASLAEQKILRSAGVKEFMFWTVQDGRVRSSHAHLQGKVFTWRSAPILPGAEIRCRCRAILPPER